MYSAKKSCWLQLHENLMGLNCCRRPNKEPNASCKARKKIEKKEKPRERTITKMKFIKSWCTMLLRWLLFVPLCHCGTMSGSNYDDTHIDLFSATFFFSSLTSMCACAFPKMGALHPLLTHF